MDDGAGRWTMDDGPWTKDRRLTIDHGDGPWTMDHGQKIED